MTALDRRESRARPFAVLGWALFIVLVLYAVFLGGTFAGIYLPGVRWTSLLIVTAGLAVWAVVAFRDPAWRPRSAIWPALVLPLIVLAIATATSPHPRLGIEYVAWSTFLVALYLLLVRILAQPFVRARIGALMAALCLGIGLTYIAIVVRDWITWWGLVGRVTIPPLRPVFEGLTFGNPSAVMTITLLCLLPAFAALPGSIRTRAVIGTVLVAVTGLVAILTGSRAGWLAIGVMIGVVGTAWLLSPGHRGRLGDALRERRARLAIGGAAAVAGIAVLLLIPSVVLRASGSGDGGRLAYFTTALRMFSDHPLTGVGPGGWVAGRIVYTRVGELDYTVPHAHDIYLQALAEMGILGALAGLVVLACLGWLGIGAIRGADDTRRRWGWAAAAALVYFAAHNALDFYANMPAALLLLAVPIAWLDATAEREISMSSAIARAVTSARRLGGPALAIACVVAFVVLARAETIAQSEQRAVAHADAAEWAAALPLAQTATRDDPDIPAYRVTEGLALAATGGWTAASETLQAAVAVDDLSQGWLAIAWALERQGRPATEVSEALARATRTGVQQPAVAFAAGWLADRIGDTAAADAAFVAALDGIPSIAADRFWTTEPGVASRWSTILDQAIALSPTAAWELALMAGDAERARSLTAGATDPSLAALAINAWGGDLHAAETIRQQAEARPLEPAPVAWAARVSAHQGDTDQAARFRAWADYIESSSFNGYEVRILSDASSTRVNAGSGARFYGSYTYRRQTPQDLIAPGLPRLIYVDEAGAD